MVKSSSCDFCGAEIDAGREFVYQFESLKYCSDEGYLEWIQHSKLYHGEPLRLCKKCNLSVEHNLAENAEEEAYRVKQTRWVRRSFTVLFISIAIYAVLYLVQMFR